MNKFLKISLIIIFVIITIIFVVIWGSREINNGENNNQIEKRGIEVLSPKENEIVTSPLKISGSVNGDGWIGFEGQIGVVKLFDDMDKELGLAILAATGEWMQTKIDFETTLWFDYSHDGVGKLVFYNENPSGEAERDKTFTLPVKLSKSSSEKTTFNVYFGYPQDLEQSCSLVFPFKREVPKTEAVAKAAIEALLKGLSGSEILAGYHTSINVGVKLRSIKIENGVAIADFSEELNKGVAGSCRVIAILSQITETLKQFSSVKQVTISVNNETEEILQP